MNNIIKKIMKRKNKPTSFTVLELLVVVSIISVVLSVILVSIGSAQAKSRDSKRTQDMVQLRNALELRALDKDGKYPADSIVSPNQSISSTGNATINSDGTITCGIENDWPEDFRSDMNPYFKVLPKDPQNGPGHCYVYSAVSASSHPDGSPIGVVYTVQELGENPGDIIGTIVGDESFFGQTGAPNIHRVIGGSSGSNNNNSVIGSPVTITNISQSHTDQGGFGRYRGQPVIVDGSGFSASGNTVELVGILGTFNVSAVTLSPTKIRFTLPSNISRTVPTVLVNGSNIPNPTQDQYTVKVLPSSGSWSNALQMGVLTYGVTPEGSIVTQSVIASASQ